MSQHDPSNEVVAPEIIERAMGGHPESWRPTVEAILEDAHEALRAEITKGLLERLRDWLGSDDEYDALVAIKQSLEANPQLVPEIDVPRRLLDAVRAAVDRFAALNQPPARCKHGNGPDCEDCWDGINQPPVGVEEEGGAVTDYNRSVAEETLIFEATERICELMERDSDLTRKALAERLGKSKGFVTQVLGGDRNMTLRTLARFADALDCRARVSLEPTPAPPGEKSAATQPIREEDGVGAAALTITRASEAVGEVASLLGLVRAEAKCDPIPYLWRALDRLRRIEQGEDYIEQNVALRDESNGAYHFTAPPDEYLPPATPDLSEQGEVAK